MNTIPECPETIEAQLQWLREGKRRAVLVTPGCVVPAVDMDVTGCEVCAEGFVLYDKRCVSGRDVRYLIERGRLGELLGYGIERKPAEPEGVVTIRGANGHEKQSVVTDADSRPAVEAAAQQVCDAGDTVHREDGKRVIEDRLKCLDGRDLKVRPYNAEQDARALAAAAKADAHSPLYPTYVIERDGEIVGYLGVNSLPLYRLWFHSAKLRASDSTRLLFMIENQFRMNGTPIVGTVINTQSPFYPCAARGGYLECAGDRLFLKQL